MADSLVNSVLDGRYVIVAPLGRGGMASVYRARDKRLERDVAIKLIHPYLATQEDFTSRFNREARSAAQLSSPYVVSVHDQGVWTAPDGNHAYLVMEYIPGPDIRKELTRLGSFTLGTALTLTEHVLRALSAAHSKGIIHRDVKPENVMVTTPLPPTSSIEHPDIHAKVADFGLARAATRHSTSAGQLMGTIAYMAPELVTEGTASPQSDLYAVGIMLYEFLTGTLPFTADTPIATAYQHINSPMPRVEAPWLPESVSSFIGLLTAKSPHDRPDNATATLRELLSFTRTIDEETLIRRVPVIPSAPANNSLGQGNTAATHIDVRTQKTRFDQRSSVSPHTHDSENSPTATRVLPSESTSGATSVIPIQSTDIDPLDSPSKQKKVGTKRLHAKRKSRVHRPSDSSSSGRHSARPTKRRRFLPLLVLLALVGMTSGWYFLFGPGQRVTVPSLVGLEYEQAVTSLNAQGITSERVEAYSDDVPSGVVIATSPGSGTSIHPDTPVSITISLGVEQVTVPDLSSLTKNQAEEALRQARLTPTFSTEYSETVEKDHVISQSLPSGTAVNHDSSISVVISQGRQPITVPQIVGKNKDEAASLIEKAGLTISVTQEYSDTVPEGSVISQTPADGTLYLGDKVSVVVSRGPEMVTIPDVVGKQLPQARQTLEDAGFKVEVKKILGGYFGTVRLQDPHGNDKARKGSTITITVV